ncbi:MAG TPA: hypothetical protein VG937_00110 [Polyangiaceae bacterium]|nr:hypothetical protein [Polyangiaceae bacterium]
MIYKSALIAAAAVAVVAIATGKSIRQQRTLTLNGLKYEITRFSNDSVEVVREDGLRFTVDLKSGAPTLSVGTRAQLDDALNQLRNTALTDVGERVVS